MTPPILEIEAKAIHKIIKKNKNLVQVRAAETNVLGLKVIVKCDGYFALS